MADTETAAATQPETEQKTEQAMGLGSEAIQEDPTVKQQMDPFYDPIHDKFNALVTKYNKTLLGLSVAYVNYSMTGNPGEFAPEDLALVESFQEPINLMAAATLHASGRF